MAKIAGIQRKNSLFRTSNDQKNDAAEIEKLAYQFFVERGYEHGHDREDWLRAEGIVKNRKRS